MRPESSQPSAGADPPSGTTAQLIPGEWSAPIARSTFFANA